MNRHPVPPKSRSRWFGCLLGLILGAVPGRAPAANPLPMRIGADQEGRSPFEGQIAAVRLYERSLRPAEITQLAKAHPNTRAALPRLVGEWMLGGGDGEGGRSPWSSAT